MPSSTAVRTCSGWRRDVLERRVRAVRAALDVDAVVAKSAPHVVHVVHGGGRRVEPQVRPRLELTPAGADPFDGQEALEESEHARVPLERLALQPVRIAGSADVDEHEVALSVHLGAARRLPRRRFDGRFAGPSLENEYRIGLPFGAGRRQNDDAKRDLSSRALRAVFPHVEAPAPNFAPDSGKLARRKVEAARAGFRGRRERGRGNEKAGNQGNDRKAGFSHIQSYNANGRRRFPISPRGKNK